ncbi:hypothetical protein BD309DRAFT_873818 [Dichomitus squalens]|uniref:Uncharacterized protein n=1 Tax=Dichomitus squalens TaxID=114155 RepID=A0A4Q9NCK5_9APHY|nr:hypothetical protein BD309DRAFT_873818 [Dichomitus squalens]TBU59488.1 hypothetical protein BD310DRAFT_1010062 [Dichomitus squalens]
MNKGPQPSHLYLHQQRTVEVIQLIEVPPPPPRSHPYTSTLASSSSFASSSCDSSDDDSEDDESVCSSYCSSEEDLAVDKAPTYDDTYKTRLNRVLAWRAGFAKAAPQGDAADEETSLAPTAPPSSPISLSPAPSLKRKADDETRWDSDDENSSQSSKRSRSLPPEPHQMPECVPSPAWQQRRWSAHSCSACDASFATLQSLRQHGTESGLNDACREAVEYGFES